MDAVAVVLREPHQIGLQRLSMRAPTAADVVVDVEWSGISTGTERLLWSGRMPGFPGMGYPLVPGYETVGRIVESGPDSGCAVGARVFIPGASCFDAVRSLFGGAASRLVVPGGRVVAVSNSVGENAVLLALAATAHHALAGSLPDLIVGHGALGRLVARIALALGGTPPVVWERDPARRDGADGYTVIDSANDPRRDYRTICDASGDAGLLDELVTRLAPNGEIVLAGFYAGPLTFAFPPAFMREARFRVAAQWQPDDMQAVRRLVESGRLSLDGIVTHRRPAVDAPGGYDTAFNDAACLKMVLDWRGGL